MLAGDVYDFPSLNSYDKGKLIFENRRLRSDLDAGARGLAELFAPFTGLRDYNPTKLVTLGNHEARLTRLIQDNPVLEGTVGLSNLAFARHGVAVYPYLQPVVVDGIAYCHQFVRGASGRVMSLKYGAPNARVQVQREMRSCTAGHQQGLSWHYQQTNFGAVIGLIAGSCYLHDEDYLSPQGTKYWRGVVMKHEVRDGVYDPMMVSLDYLKRKYS